MGRGLMESGYLLPSAEVVGSSDHGDEPRGGFKSRNSIIVTVAGNTEQLGPRHSVP